LADAGAGRAARPARALLTAPRRVEQHRRAVPNEDTRGRRAQASETEAFMKHSSIRELFDYWNTRRGGRPAPERGDIEPGAIRRVLADTFILGFDAGAGHPFRIAGTRVCAAFDRELKGEAFVDLWTMESASPIRDLLHIVAQDSVGVVAGARGENAEGSALALELLLLPLSHCGRTDARVLGALAPTETPYWLGTHALGRLTLGTLRYLGPGLDCAPRVLPLPSGHSRRGLVVYDGGQI